MTDGEKLLSEMRTMAIEYSLASPLVARVPRWMELVIRTDIAISDGTMVDDVTHERVRVEFQRYGFDDYEVFVP